MPAKPLAVPTLAKTPALPAPGLYFDMDFATYLAAPAIGSSLLKDALVDPYLAWAHSWLNPNKEEKEAEHYLYGQAFHCRLLGGRDAYEARFYVEPDKRSFEELLVTDADVTKAISEFEETPVKGNKTERVKQLLLLWDDAPIWDEIKARAERDAGGRTAIKFDWHVKFEASAAMIEADPDLLELVRSDGYSEVSLFWTCPRTGLPKKARIDRLRLDGAVDVKTFANMHEKSLRRAIPKAIANEQYPFQASHYLEGLQAVKWLIRQELENGEIDDISVFQSVESFDHARTDWARHWAMGKPGTADSWTWLFVQKGDAPICIGWEFDVTGMLREQFDTFCNEASDVFVEMFGSFGPAPWIEQHGIVKGEDTMIPAYILEI